MRLSRILIVMSLSLLAGLVIASALVGHASPAAHAQPTGPTATWPITLQSGGAQTATWNFSNARYINPLTNAAEGGPGMALQDAVFTISPTLYALDTSLVVNVDGVQFVAPDTVTATAQSISTGEIDLAGLRASVNYTALDNRPSLRTLISLRNPQTMPVTVSVNFASNFSAGFNAQYVTATGGPELTTADRWLVAADSALTPAPDVLHVFFGPLNPPMPTVVSQTVYEDYGQEGAAITYTVSILPNMTRHLLFFTELAMPGTGEAAASAYNVTDQSGALFVGLTPDELKYMVNWFGNRVFLPVIQR